MRDVLLEMETPGFKHLAYWPKARENELAPALVQLRKAVNLELNDDDALLGPPKPPTVPKAAKSSERV